MSLDKFFQGARGLRWNTLWNKFLRLRYILTWRTHLYILLHEGVLMILQFILHPLGAAPILAYPVLVSYLLWPNYCLYTTFSDSWRRPLIINSGHILIGRTVCTWYLLVLHHVLLILSLLPLITALLLYVHLHRGVIVWVVGIEIRLNQTIARLNVPARTSTTWQDCSVAWRSTIAVAVCGSAHAEIGIFYVHGLKSGVFFCLLPIIIIKVIRIRWI